MWIESRAGDVASFVKHRSLSRRGTAEAAKVEPAHGHEIWPQGSTKLLRRTHKLSRLDKHIQHTGCHGFFDVH
jgi:hypothetical protein